MLNNRLLNYQHVLSAAADGQEQDKMLGAHSALDHCVSVIRVAQPALLKGLVLDLRCCRRTCLECLIHPLIYVYARRDTYTHACMHTYIFAFLPTYPPTYLHTCIYTYIQRSEVEEFTY